MSEQGGLSCKLLSPLVWPVYVTARFMPPLAALTQASHFDVKIQLAGVSPSPQCRLRAEVTRQRRRKEHEMAEIEKRHHLHIVLTPRQYRLLCSQAKQCRLTKRAYLASLIEGQPVKSRPSQEIKDLRTEIHHIGNNINQVARSVNAGIAKPEDARRGLYLLDQVYELMFQVANK